MPGLPFAANHLWQSTGFAAVAVLLAFALRANHARARYWLWLAASVKFLVPFSALAAIGGSLGRWLIPAAPVAHVPIMMAQIVQPFAPIQDVVLPTASSPAPASLLPALLLAVWLCGFAAVLLYWRLRWSRVAAAIRSSTPWSGRPGLLSSVRIVSSRAKLEPGVFGIFRPVLWLPAGIEARLDEWELQAILAHEFCHLRRRDNLTAALHMVVEAIFWFHPLVWWLGARLTEERERACDEEVVRLGGEPQIYAESILKVCEFYLASPVACAAGVTGGELKKRIEGIMTNRFARELNFGKKLLLVAVALVGVVAPVAIGLLSPPRGSAQSGTPPNGHPTFEVASNYYEVVSIKRGDPGVTVCGYHPSPGQLRLDNCPLPYLIAGVYGVRQDRLVGLPAWTSSETYSLVAKSVAPAKHSEQWAMLSAVFKDRFSLKYHSETRQQRVYELSAQASGIRFPEAVPGTCAPFDPDAPAPTSSEQAKERSERTCGMGLSERLREGGLRVSVKAITMAQLAKRLQQYVDRPVVDRIGSDKLFDVDLTFDNRALSLSSGEAPQTEQMLRGDGPAKKGGTYPGESGLPNVFTALKKVGLSLTSGRGGVEVMVIDQLERPSEN